MSLLKLFLKPGVNSSLYSGHYDTCSKLQNHLQSKDEENGPEKNPKLTN